MITIRRACACGDIIQAIPIAQYVMDDGHKVKFQCVPKFHPIVERFGVVPSDYVEGSVVDVELDNTYEQYRGMLKTISIRKWFYEFASPQLNRFGIKLDWEKIRVPAMPKKENERIKNLLSPYKKPWVMICPRSATPVNDVPRNSELYQCSTRCVPDEIWSESSKAINGSCFWLGVHGPAPNGIADLNVRDMKQVMEWIDHADTVVTVDTGPMHIALAMEIPTIAIYQSIDPRMTFEGAKNLTVIKSDLDCLGCCLLECPINPKSPPCQFMESSIIASAVNNL